MRFEQLSVPAYGPFTAFDLQLPVGGSDFHLIYGPNEAGKSSLLRAIRDLLYGIHGQTTDNFRHAYKDLRIAGSIAASDGRRLRFQRRKGNKDTLLDADGQPLPDDALSVFLGNVDQDFFSSLFGLGADELREGAEALLQGRGEVGQALFSASLAGTPVHRVLEQLDAEARAHLQWSQHQERHAAPGRQRPRSAPASKPAGQRSPGGMGRGAGGCWRRRRTTATSSTPT